MVEDPDSRIPGHDQGQAPGDDVGVAKPVEVVDLVDRSNDEDDWWTNTAALKLGDINALRNASGAPVAQEEAGTVNWFTAEGDDFDSEIGLPRRQHHVTVVMVTHNGGVWLHAALTALAKQSRPPDTVVGVDTGSTDDSGYQLKAAFGADRVVSLTGKRTFGEAVWAGVEQVGARQVAPDGGPSDRGPSDSGPSKGGQTDEVIEWVWMLHDDSAPRPGCLDALLVTADQNPSAAILGPKILGWRDHRLLLEAGVSITSSGRRFTGLERGEHDQGQSDGVRDVLSVSSAGMLVRRDVWIRLKGFDRRLPLYRDDLDFCWRARRAGERVLIATDAVLQHREAATNGVRSDALGGRPHRADRAASVHILLSETSFFIVPFLAVRLFLVSAVRALVYLLGKDFQAARDEVLAVFAVALRPLRLMRSRRLISSTSVEPASVVRHLRPTMRAQFRHGFELVAGILTTSGSLPSVAGGQQPTALDSGPMDEESAYLGDTGPGFIRRILVRPSFLLFMAIFVYVLAATRTLWWGDGVLQGGALLPVMQGAGDLWGSYSDAWHNIGPGSTTPAAPYLMVVFGLAVILFGKASLAITVIMLLGIPLAAWSMFFALRGAVASVPVRVWAGATYALVPALTGAVSSGRIGTVIAAFMLPFVARSAARLARGQGTFRRSAGTALMLAILVSALPITWVIAVIMTVGFSIALHLRVGKRARPVIRRLSFAVIAAIVLLMPWSLQLFLHPALFLVEPGVASGSLSDPSITSFDVLMLHPGGPGMTPLWATFGLVIAGFAALLRRDQAIVVGCCWAIAGVCLVFGIVQTLVAITPPDVSSPLESWPGGATLIISAAMIAAASLTTEGLRERMSGASFNIGQPLTVFVVVIAIFTPVLSAYFWFPEAEGQLRRAPLSAVPAFVEADALSPQAPRTLVLRQDREGSIRYSLINGAGPILGDADAAPPADVWTPIDPLVAGLASGRGGDEVIGLAGYGVRYVLLSAGTSEALIPFIDSEPGLRRLSSAGTEVLWEVAGVTSRARVLSGTSEVGLEVATDPGSADRLGTSPYLNQLIPSSSGDPAKATESQVVLGATADSRWRARTADGGGTPDQALAPSAPGGQLAWSQAFTVPAGQHQVIVTFNDISRTRWLWFQLVVLVILVVLALPSRKKEDEERDNYRGTDAGVDIRDTSSIPVIR